MANRLQLWHIERYHRHLSRLGRTSGLEESARVWIHKYARLWRLHFDGPSPRRAA